MCVRVCARERQRGREKNFLNLELPISYLEGSVIGFYLCKRRTFTSVFINKYKSSDFSRFPLKKETMNLNFTIHVFTTNCMATIMDHCDISAA